MRISPTNWILSALSLLITIVSLLMVQTGSATWLEAASFLTGAACVWLTVKENVWNFPLGLINVSTFCIVFFQARLLGDASLQIVYFILGVIGWYLWLKGGERHSPLTITRSPFNELLLMLILVAIATAILWQTLPLLGGSSSFWDALTTSISLAAQWLLNKKRLENWLFWIIADIIYIPLYFSKGLLLTSALYAVFLVMATMGLLQWRTSLKRNIPIQQQNPTM